MRKRVLIDTSAITSVPDGLSIYIINLLKHLPEASWDELDFKVLIDPDVERADFLSVLQSRPFGRIEARLASIGPKRDWQMRQFLRSKGGEFDLFHSTSNNFPLAMRGGVATIHDITFRRWFHNPGGVPGTRQLAVSYLNRVIDHSIRHAAKVITVSESTRREIIDAYGTSAGETKRIRPIHLGWEHLLDYPEPAAGDVGLPPHGYLFFLGSNRVHKNLSGLLDAFEIALSRIPAGKMLLISGGSERISPSLQDQVNRLNSAGTRVRFTGLISNAEVRRHYERADAFIFPSLAEGFGIPVLESFHFGTPLLASRTTSIPEVAGDAALYFDPFEIGSIAETIVRFYADPTLAPALVERGRARLSRFSWVDTASQTVDVYRGCLS